MVLVKEWINSQTESEARHRNLVHIYTYIMEKGYLFE